MMRKKYLQIKKIKNIVNVNGDFNYRRKLPKGKYFIKTKDGAELEVQAVEVLVDSAKNYRKVEMLCEHENLNLSEKINEHVQQNQHPVFMTDPIDKEEYRIVPFSCFSYVSALGKFFMKADGPCFDAQIVVDSKVLCNVKAYESTTGGQRDLKVDLETNDMLLLEKALNDNKKCEVWWIIARNTRLKRT